MSAPPPPATMRAWTLRSRGPVRTHLHLSTVATPAAPSAAQVLVRVSHVALNFSTADVLATLPTVPLMAATIPELEFSGVVHSAGPAAPAHLREPGARVLGFQTVAGAFFAGRGVLAEWVRVPAAQLVRVPDGLAMDQASGLIGAGSTALKMAGAAGVRAGDTVLVNGASGSVGGQLVHVCKARGARVVGVASGANEALVRGLGVDEFIDYRSCDLPAHLAAEYGARPLDHILDCCGSQALYVNSPKYLKPDGAVVNVGAFEGMWMQMWNWFANSWWPRLLGGTPRRYVMFSTPPTQEAALVLAKMAEEGKLRVLVDSVFDMEDALSAYDRVATKRAKGKVVIKVQDV